MLDLAFLYKILPTKKSFAIIAGSDNMSSIFLEKYDLTSRKECPYRWSTSLIFARYLAFLLQHPVKQHLLSKLVFDTTKTLDNFIASYLQVKDYPGLIPYTFVSNRNLIRPDALIRFYLQNRRLFFLSNKNVKTIILLFCSLFIVSITRSIQQPYGNILHSFSRSTVTLN